MRNPLPAFPVALLIGGLAACATPVRTPSSSEVALIAPPPQEQEEGQEAKHEAGGEHEEKKNVIGVFLGSTIRDGDGNGTIAVEYKRHLNEGLAVGGILEWVPDDREEVLIAPLWLYPWRELFLSVGPGLEFEEDDETSLLFRVGIGWKFELENGFLLEPEINYDIVDGIDNALVVGVSLGYEF